MYYEIINRAIWNAKDINTIQRIDGVIANAFRLHHISEDEMFELADLNMSVEGVVTGFNVRYKYNHITV